MEGPLGPGPLVLTSQIFRPTRGPRTTLVPSLRPLKSVHLGSRSFMVRFLFLKVLGSPYLRCPISPGYHRHWTRQYPPRSLDHSVWVTVFCTGPRKSYAPMLGLRDPVSHTLRLGSESQNSCVPGPLKDPPVVYNRTSRPLQGPTCVPFEGVSTDSRGPGAPLCLPSPPGRPQYRLFSGLGVRWEFSRRRVVRPWSGVRSVPAENGADGGGGRISVLSVATGEPTDSRL